MPRQGCEGGHGRSGDHTRRLSGRSRPGGSRVGEVYPACVRIDPAWCCQGVRTQSHRHIPRSQVYSLSVIVRSKCGVVCPASRLAVRSQLIVVLLEPPLSAKTTKSALPCASSSQNPRKIRVPRPMQNARPGQDSSFGWVDPPDPHWIVRRPECQNSTTRAQSPSSTTLSVYLDTAAFLDA
jgi:hypothetical protein